MEHSSPNLNGTNTSTNSDTTGTVANANANVHVGSRAVVDDGNINLNITTLNSAMIMNNVMNSVMNGTIHNVMSATMSPQPQLHMQNFPLSSAIANSAATVRASTGVGVTVSTSAGALMNSPIAKSIEAATIVGQPPPMNGTLLIPAMPAMPAIPIEVAPLPIPTITEATTTTAEAAATPPPAIGIGIATPESTLDSTPPRPRGKGGRPKGSKTKKRTGPSVDPTKVYHRVSFYRKIKKCKITAQVPGLREAYQKLEKARIDTDEMKASVHKLQKQYDEIKHQLEAAKSAVNLNEEIEEYASREVREIEMTMPNNAWNQHFERLKEYKIKHGHVNLPSDSKEDSEFGELCRWLKCQKKMYWEYVDGKVKTKNPHRIEALQNLGVQWNTRVGKWKISYDKLVIYKNENGHTEIPTKHYPDKNLSAWITTQRYEYKLMKEDKPSTLTAERVALLNEIGFVFNVFEKRWSEMYNKLLEFKNTHGHINVPERSDGNKALAKWVQRQRMEFQMILNGEGSSKKCRLSQEHISRLQAIDFIF